MNVLITGATGLLGSNFLNELIKTYSSSLNELTITLLGRDKGGIPFSERIKQQVIEEEHGYFDSEIPHAEILHFLNHSIHYIPYSLQDNPAAIIDENYHLQAMHYNHVFHIAALTDFRNTAGVIKKLRQINVEGTRHLLTLLKSMSIGQVNYIGSAYSCGKTYGDISPDYINLNQEFRNPYEKTKLEAEILVRQFSRNTQIPCKYFRPSTIGGRLLEKPLGKVNKFDVFYSLGTFLLREKRKFVKEDSLFQLGWNCSMRLHFNAQSGLNIVPADFAAKAILKIALSNLEEESFHIASETEYPHNNFTKEIFNICNIQGIKGVEFIPEDKNQLEKFYYKTVGNIFKDYLGEPEIKFNLNNLISFYNDNNLKDYKISDDNFRTMLSYAKPHIFGLA